MVRAQERGPDQEAGLPGTSGQGAQPVDLPQPCRSGAVEQLETRLAAADVVLTADVLGRIDEIVPPGTIVDPAGSSFANPDLEPAARRRQH